jgi:Fe-S-cluster containining protein
MTDRVAKLSPFEAIERIQDACDRTVERAVRNHQPPVTCAIGCAHCCRQPVFITSLEGLAVFDRVTRSLVDDFAPQKIAKYLKELESRPGAVDGVGALKTNLQGRGPAPTPEQRAAVYGVNCPFLWKKTCIIYGARPLMCREHISFDDVGKCKRDVPFFGLDKPMFHEVSAWLTRDLPRNHSLFPVWEYEQAAEVVPDRMYSSRELDELLRWKIGSQCQRRLKIPQIAD